MERADNITSVRRAAIYLAHSFMADRSRWFLWSPICLALGATIYFALPYEPSRHFAWWIVLAGTTLLIPVLVFNLAIGWRLVAIALFLVACGFCAGEERTCRVMAPMLSSAIGPVMVAGQVQEVDLADKGPRIVLANPTIDTLTPALTPHRIRLRLTRYAETPEAGSIIAVRAIVMTPPGPVQPGAHDFRRDAFFDGIGAVGYAVGYPHILQAGGRQQDWLPALRMRISDRIETVLGKTPEAAIATAYLTGARGLIDEQTATDMRNSGLAHLLAISGMKVGLVAVLVFACVRLMLALFPGLALRVPVRKIAACAGILAAIAYTGLAAAPIPALRSVLMTSMAMLAILFDRQSFSLRLAAIAAILVIIVLPDSAASVSFQMSFGAVVALIAFYEAYRHRIAAGYHHASHMRRIVMDIGKIALTTFIATLVTAPLALFHFQQEANYSIPANAFAIPLNDIWIMPCGVLSLLLMPLGLDKWPLEAMGIGIHVMLRVAHIVSQWPGAITHIPLMPPAVLGFASFGGLWIILWRRRWRRLGLIPIAIAILIACQGSRPDVLVAEDASHAAVRLHDGTLAISRETRKDFTAENWDRLNGTTGISLLLESGSTPDGTAECDAEACLYRMGTHSIAILRDPAAANALCDKADILISRWPMQVQCNAKDIIDPVTAAATGAIAIYPEGTGIRLDTAFAHIGDRPWWVNIAVKAPPIVPEP